VDYLEMYLMYKLGLWMVWKGAWSMVWVMVGTQRADWEYGWLGKVPCVRNGIVDGLERCLEYGLGHGRYLVCGLGMWMAWKGTLCTEWDCGCLERCPEYGLVDDC
jgi:hypothetical protein